MRRPALRFLNQANDCNYCHAVRGFIFDEPPRIRARLLWVHCVCGRKHLACFACARRIGSVNNGDGRRRIAQCAKGYYRRVVKPTLKTEGQKGA